MKRWRGKVPFDIAGNQMHHELDRPYYEPVDWRDWCCFTGTLTLEKVRSGNSAKYLVVREEETDLTFILFVVDLLDLCAQTIIDHGKITGTWGFCKRGQNYGVYLMEEQ